MAVKSSEHERAQAVTTCRWLGVHAIGAVSSAQTASWSLVKSLASTGTRGLLRRALLWHADLSDEEPRERCRAHIRRAVGIVLGADDVALIGGGARLNGLLPQRGGGEVEEEEGPQVRCCSCRRGDTANLSTQVLRRSQMRSMPLLLRLAIPSAQEALHSLGLSPRASAARGFSLPSALPALGHSSGEASRRQARASCAEVGEAVFDDTSKHRRRAARGYRLCQHQADADVLLDDDVHRPEGFLAAAAPSSRPDRRRTSPRPPCLKVLLRAAPCRRRTCRN